MSTIVTTVPDLTGTYLTYLWISLAVIAAIVLLLWLGWRNRKRRQAEVPAPIEVPTDLLDAEPEAAAEGMIVGTVTENDYLDRIAVHQLGIRTEGRVEVHFGSAGPRGITVFRAGSRNWFIPAQQFIYAGTDSGMIGKFVERDGLTIIGWQLGDIEVATGFRPQNAAEGRTLLEALKRHSSGQTDPDQPDPGQPGPHHP